MEGLRETLTMAHRRVLCRLTPCSDMLTGSDGFPEREPHLRASRRLCPIKSATQ